MKRDPVAIQGLYGQPARTPRAQLAAQLREARRAGYRAHTVRLTARDPRRGWIRERQFVDPRGHVLLCIFH